MEPGDLPEWVAAAVGEPVAGIRRIALGFSRATFAVELTGGRELIARLDVAESPLAGTPISLTREREVHAALAGRGLPRAALLAAAPDGSALLFERVEGTPELDHLSAPDRVTVLDDYLDRIAELHQLRPGELGPEVGTDDGSLSAVVEADLRRWETALDLRARGPWPVLRIAFAALRRHAPREEVCALSLCHGDVGPRNFLHDGRRVTALLDWEFWHVGEAFDDLAWWIWRAHERSTDCGDLASQLNRWSQATGIELDAARIDYYQIVVKVRSLVIAAVAVENEVRGVDHSVLLPIVESLSFQICRELLHLEGIELDGPPIESPDPAEAMDDAIDRAFGFAERCLREAVVPELRSAEAVRQARAAVTYLEHFESARQRQSALADADRDDLARAGVDPVPAAAIDARLCELADDPSRASELLELLGRRSRRRLQLWPTALARLRPEPIRIADLHPDRLPV